MAVAAPQILTTPTKAYNLRNRLVPLSSPEHLQEENIDVDDIQNEQPPPEMNELACEALTEELKQMQVLRNNCIFFCFKVCVKSILNVFRICHKRKMLLTTKHNLNAKKNSRVNKIRYQNLEKISSALCSQALKPRPLTGNLPSLNCLPLAA